jgi:hypothetical protein
MRRYLVWPHYLCAGHQLELIAARFFYIPLGGCGGDGHPRAVVRDLRGSAGFGTRYFRSLC